MWEKRATSAEGKTIRIAESSDMDSWEAVLRPCAKFCKDVQVLGKDLSFEREKEVEMLLPNYTKWCGMSCGDIWTMMRHGREKGGVLER